MIEGNTQNTITAPFAPLPRYIHAFILIAIIFIFFAKHIDYSIIFVYDNNAFCFYSNLYMRFDEKKRKSGGMADTLP